MGVVRRIEVRVRYAFKSLKVINNPHLGDKVIYKGIECSLIQGVASL